MNNRYPFVNLPLPYAYDALEPYIDTKTMRLHHDRHLQTYIENLNAVLKTHPELQQYTLEELVTNWQTFPTEVQTLIRNNGGGIYNHRFYFDGLNPPEEIPNNRLYRELQEQFGSFSEFADVFKQAALSVFGSGYAWLAAEKGMLKILITPNQDVPDLNALTPIFCIDVWEHAYYLKHYNLRGDYVNDWFKVLNWSTAEEQYQSSCL